MRQDTDEKHLIAGISNGDKKVFKLLFEVYYRRLYLYACSYVENAAASEDIVQELFFNLWEKRKEIVIASSLSSYLFRAVHNKCIQYLRHNKIVAGFGENHQIKLKEADILLESAGDYTFPEIKLREIEKIVSDTFSLLPEKTREIFSLSRDHSNSNKEIAEKLTVSVKTVEYHITKTLNVLRKSLKDYFPDYSAK